MNVTIKAGNAVSGFEPQYKTVENEEYILLKREPRGIWEHIQSLFNKDLTFNEINTTVVSTVEELDEPFYVAIRELHDEAVKDGNVFAVVVNHRDRNTEQWKTINSYFLGQFTDEYFSGEQKATSE